MKVKLDKAYFWEGKSYAPGESVEVPDELAQALGAGFFRTPDIPAWNRREVLREPAENLERVCGGNLPPANLSSENNLTAQSPPPPVPNAEEPAVQDPPSEEVPPSTPTRKTKA